MSSFNADIIFKDFEFEREMRNSSYTEKSRHANNLWDEFIRSLSQSDVEIAIKSRNFAAGIKYKHPGLEGAEYFLHPLRVGSIGGLINSADKLISAQVGLLHNIYEVTELERSKIVELFGSTIDSVLWKLTINRKLQSEKEYLETYYGEIAALPQNLGLIKVLDKIDNLFLLGITAAPDVKESYLREVNEYLRPLCEKVAPKMINTLNKIIEHVRY